MERGTFAQILIKQSLAHVDTLHYVVNLESEEIALVVCNDLRRDAFKSPIKCTHSLCVRCY